MPAHQYAHPLMQNRLLAKVSHEELNALSPHLKKVSLSHGQAIILPNEPITDIYFPLNALLSLVTVMEDGSMVESGSVGREGMAGVPVLLDANVTPMQTLVQIPGEAIQVKAQVIKDAFDQEGSLHYILNRYIHTLIVTGSQSAACNCLHRLEERLCRWLLMSSDGVASDELNLTQEFLATMLGVRRAGVSNAAMKLQNEGLIQYKRGNIQILDRKRMEACACECYRAIKDEWDRLLC
ncbi:Crp/Fnr family transcriptional regulator [Nostoc sp. 106C]|uniref:Crp/Fnr family transcriptional regulator n=1 Tax=Nostoc sp. 106C TaxID=1932667 RepID=UPI000A3D580A|nr:Crp/Fnr family transcriptional regulator [Nostoc sp. 106C]OUL28865.1 Crp/Fnr family transcriptional regulator [Nostoc sp. 106C]